MFCTIKPVCGLLNVRRGAYIQKTDPPKEIRFPDRGQHHSLSAYLLAYALNMLSNSSLPALVARSV